MSIIAQIQWNNWVNLNSDFTSELKGKSWRKESGLSFVPSQSKFSRRRWWEISLTPFSNSTLYPLISDSCHLLKQKVSGNSVILSPHGQWPDSSAQFPPESAAIWGQGQAGHFATIGLSHRSYFTNRYESLFQQKVEIRHQTSNSFWDNLASQVFGLKIFIGVL